MKFIKVRDGFSVRASEIEAIGRIDDLTCEIYTCANVYQCNYPCETILYLMERSDSESRTNQLLEAIAKNQQRVVM
jgi:hypothetical protein